MPFETAMVSSLLGSFSTKIRSLFIEIYDYYSRGAFGSTGLGWESVV